MYSLLQSRESLHLNSLAPMSEIQLTRFSACVSFFFFFSEAKKGNKTVSPRLASLFSWIWATESRKRADCSGPAWKRGSSKDGQRRATAKVSLSEGEGLLFFPSPSSPVRAPRRRRLPGALRRLRARRLPLSLRAGRGAEQPRAPPSGSGQGRWRPPDRAALPPARPGLPPLGARPLPPCRGAGGSDLCLPLPPPRPALLWVEGEEEEEEGERWEGLHWNKQAGSY